MDRSKWEYKKLGEVCTMYQPKTISTQELVDDGDYLVYGANGVIGRYDKYNHEQSEILMTCRGATCGTINISEPFSWINGNAMVIHPTNNDFVRDFLVYQLKAVDKSSVITGAAQPQITRQMLQTLSVVKAPISDQQRIVAELDCLNEMIALKQEQLKEFDKLAQSIFYDMFGDPVSNEKGWQIKKIGDVASFYNGKAHENDIDENGEFVLINAKFIASDGMILKRTNKQLFPLFENDIVMVMSDVPNGKALARCFLIKHNNIYSLNQRICAFRDYSLNSIFLLFLLNRNKYYLRFDDGNGQTNLRKNDVLGCPVILPPLALQQQFAEKIQAIEVQKELVRKSIAETQHLLDSRMDYYFD